MMEPITVEALSTFKLNYGRGSFISSTQNISDEDVEVAKQSISSDHQGLEAIKEPKIDINPKLKFKIGTLIKK
jgi:hypothetical protein